MFTNDVENMLTIMGRTPPSISADGSLVAGESNLCFKVGDVDSTPEEITRTVRAMSCNRCGLVDNLTQEQKVAINEARIHLR